MVKDDKDKDYYEKPSQPKPAAKIEGSHASPKLATDAEKQERALADLKKAQEQSAKVEQAAIAKAATINQRLIRDGSARRIIGGVRNGEPKFFWGNFVPTQALTDEELEAVGSL